MPPLTKCVGSLLMYTHEPLTALQAIVKSVGNENNLTVAVELAGRQRFLDRQANRIDKGLNLSIGPFTCLNCIFSLQYDSWSHVRASRTSWQPCRRLCWSPYCACQCQVQMTLLVKDKILLRQHDWVSRTGRARLPPRSSHHGTAAMGLLTFATPHPPLDSHPFKELFKIHI
jgi:hypothetical protein